MRQFLSVFRFEFLTHLKNKISVIVTIGLVVAIALTLSYPKIEKIISEKNPKEEPGEEKYTQIALYNASDIDNSTLMSSFGAAFNNDGGYSLIFFIDEDDDSAYNTASSDLELLTHSGNKTGLEEIRRIDREKLKDSVEDGQYDSIIEITGPRSLKYISKTLGLYDKESNIASQVLLTIDRFSVLSKKGMSEAEITSLLSSDVDVETIVTGKDQTQSFAYTYAIIMILYMVLLIYGQFVASSVASEKSSRAMEVLITSAKPTNLMFGKILGTGFAGLLQLIIVFAATIGFYKLNKGEITNDLIVSLFGMPVSAALYAILFFVLGYFIYAFMFGAAGSLASRSEDLGALTMPINIIFIAAFMVAIFGMTGNGVNETYFVVCSFLPTFAPLVMLVRVCMGTVAVWEIIFSVTIQLLSIVGLGILCAKIYRAGVLLYGNTPKAKDLVKIIRTSSSK